MIRDYVVQTHPCAEVLAKSNLEARAFDVYLPTVVYEGRTGRLREKRYTTIEPLFPGYLFVTLDIACAEWRRISSAKGVRRLLGENSERPTALPCGALQDLRERFNAGEFVKRIGGPQITAGDRIRVTNGAFEGYAGTCTQSRGDRVHVLLSLLMGAVPVTLPVGMVAVA